MGVAKVSQFVAFCDSCDHKEEFAIIGNKYYGTVLRNAGWSTRPHSRYGETWHCPECTKNGTPRKPHYGMPNGTY